MGAASRVPLATNVTCPAIAAGSPPRFSYAGGASQRYSLLSAWITLSSNGETVTGSLREPVYTSSPDLRLAMIDALGRLPARDRAIVVLRWQERSDRFYVLTSYPEDD